MDNDWNGLADLIANLITKYAGVLDLDNLPNPTPVNNIEDKNRFGIAFFPFPWQWKTLNYIVSGTNERLTINSQA